MLSPRHPELRLILVGVGSTDEDLQMHVAALGLTGIVSFLGSRDDELAVLSAADLGWVIADHDTGAFAALDLMALRVPVLVTRGIIAQRYIVDGSTGILLPPADAPSIAATIASLLAHEERRTAMGAAGRARVAREYPEAAMVSGFVRAADAARDRTRWIR
jgi:glycosyltransferase involved in cell wall biosynthesis